MYATGPLPYKVKMQYVQISNTLDTSILHPILGQFIFILKGCMDMIFDMVETAFRALIVCLFLQESSKVKESIVPVI